MKYHYIQNLPKLELLSVAEDDGQSHRMAAALRQYESGQLWKFYISVDDIGNIVLKKIKTSDTVHGITLAEIRLSPVDLDSMIEFLTEAKNFISEAHLLRKLSGQT